MNLNHIYFFQIAHAPFNDTEDSLDMNDMTDPENHKKLMQNMGKATLERAKKEPVIAEKVLRIVKEAERRGVFNNI